MDPTTLLLAQVIAQIWPLIAPFLPERWQQGILFGLAIASPIAGLIISRWTPAKGSRLEWLWRVLALLNVARNRNAPVSQPGLKSMAIPTDADRRAIAEKVGIDPLTANPRRLLKSGGVPQPIPSDPASPPG